MRTSDRGPIELPSRARIRTDRWSEITRGARQLRSGVPPGAVGALDGGGSEMTTASTAPESRAPLSAPDVRARKGNGPPLVMVTAYDYPSARVADAAAVDMILVGDTLAMVVLGYEDTLQVTTDVMAHHVAAAARA